MLTRNRSQYRKCQRRQRLPQATISSSPTDMTFHLMTTPPKFETLLSCSATISSTTALLCQIILILFYSCCRKQIAGLSLRQLLSLNLTTAPSFSLCYLLTLRLAQAMIVGPSQKFRKRFSSPHALPFFQAFLNHNLQACYLFF